MGYNGILQGPLPTELGLLTGSSWLGVEHTQVSGTLSTWLGSLTNLFQLNVQHTLMSGSIPAEIALLATNHSLQSFNTTGSLLSGEVVDELCEATFFRCDMDELCGCDCSCLG